MKHFPIFVALEGQARGPVGGWRCCPCKATPAAEDRRKDHCVCSPLPRPKSSRGPLKAVWSISPARCLPGTRKAPRCFTPQMRTPPKMRAPQRSPAKTARWSISSIILRTASSSPPAIVDRDPVVVAIGTEGRPPFWRAPSRLIWKPACPPRWAISGADRQILPQDGRGVADGAPSSRFLAGLLLFAGPRAMDQGGEAAVQDASIPCSPPTRPGKTAMAMSPLSVLARGPRAADPEGPQGAG